MSKVKFQNKDKKKILQYAINAIQLYNTGTTSLSGGNIFKFKRIVYILGNLINIEGFPHNNDQKRSLISRGIARFSKYKRKSLNSLLKAIETEVVRWDKQVSNKFFVVFPWNVENKTLRGTRHFIIERMKLKTRSLSYVARNFDFKGPYHLLNQNKNMRGNIRNSTYIIVEVFAKNEADAFNTAYQKEELLRALCNFALSYGIISWQWGRPSPLAPINPPSVILIFNAERKFVEYWTGGWEYRYKLLRLKPRHLKAIKEIIKDFKKLKSNKLKDILIDCLKLYNYALDEIERGYTFLHLWQILELIALKEPSGISLEKVKNRIKAIYKSNPVISDVLDALFRKRNQLVHEGKLSNFSLEDVNQIKLIAEGCINFLFSHVNKLKNKEGLHDFYENITQSESRLKRKITVLKYIRKIKN